MNSPKQASPDHPIHELIAKRWSPYSYSDRPVSGNDLASLFEAARWAPSSYNEQPWSYLVASKEESEAFAKLLSCLVEGNQVWAKAAPVLAIGCTNLRFSRNGKPNSAALHDLGLASAMICLEAMSRGLYVHQMVGILPDRVREVYRVPEGIQPLTGLAIGYLAEPNSAPKELHDRDLNPRNRKPLTDFVFSGEFGTAASLSK